MLCRLLRSAVAVFGVVGWLTWLATGVRADQPISIEAIAPDVVVDFDNDIAPILRANCLSCHNKTTPRGELILETVTQMLQGGESGPALVIGNGLESRLLRTAAHLDDPNMPPPENKVKAVDLTPRQLGLLKLWIDQGAKTNRTQPSQIAWETRSPELHTILATAISPDGQYIVCSRGRRIEVYHLPTRQRVTELVDESLATLFNSQRVAHRDLIPALAFSPDGTIIASGSHREIKIWQRQDHLEVNEVIGNETISTTQLIAQTKLIESPDGKRTAEITENMVRLRDNVSGAVVAELRGDPRMNDAAAQAARQSDFWASEANFRQQEVQRIDDEVRLLVERTKTLGNDLVASEKTLASKERDYRSATQAIHQQLEKVRSIYRELEPQGLDYKAPDEKTKRERSAAEEKLAATSQSLKELESVIPSLTDKVVQLRSELTLASQRVEKKQQAALEATGAMAAANQEKSLASRRTGAAKAAAEAQLRATTAVCFSPDSTQLATATVDGKLHLWSAIDGRSIVVIDAQDQSDNEVVLLSWHPQALVATMADGTHKEYRRTSQWSLMRSLGGDTSPLQDRVSALKFSHDGALLAAGSGEFSRSGELTLWNPINGLLIHTVSELHRDSILAIAFSHDDRRLATGSSDRTMKVLATENWHVEKSFEGHTSHVLSVDWKADGRTLASAGADGVVKIWDYASGDRIRNLEGWNNEVTGVHFIGNTGNVLVSSGDPQIQWLDDSGSIVRTLATPSDYVQSAAISADGSVIAAGGHNGILYVWDGPSGQLLNLTR